ncbi:MAG TPA: Verru_Chthon cassette protein A, partial [Terrimicrobiaceae bacterium]|nr:Verru_Chthon cassette protein A [Terrimicrobiaceae bacterium]
MKPPSPILPAKTKSGFALVIILSAIVLLLALVVGFFSRVQSEIQSSSSYQSAESARNLSDYAVNLVLTQIKAGTAGVDASGNPLAWASQPGAIRTYDTSGSLTSVYKLYSSPTMVSPTINPSSEATALNAWTGSPALFADLNEPLNGQYPILDPSADGIVKGFRISGAPVATGAGANTAPMPANWLYVLKDGQIIAPTGSGNTANVTGATAANPIIGRVAFWTDDETSKININTAGGGPWTEPIISQTYKFGTASTLTYNGPAFSSYWTTPVVFSKQEGALAGSQPVKYEYQRYPGHPATTFLSAALPSLTTTDALFSVLPRLENTNSSNGGTILGGAGSTLQPVVPDANRLYQSVDEILFSTQSSSTGRQPNDGLTKQDLERAKFFTTANSRAPDVNQFNQPRIGLWPINASTAKRTPFDQLIAFCETVNAQPYYFVRSAPDSESIDISQSRNSSILAYLRSKTGQPVPGFGGAGGVLGKYGADKDQIITEIFDYIRTANPRDTSQGSEAFYFSPKLGGAVVPSYDSSTSTRGFGRFPTVTKVGVLFYGVAINQQDADQTKTTAVRRVAAASPASARVGVYNAAAGTDRIGPPGNETNFPAKNTLIMRALLLIEMFIPAQGYDFVFPR